ncbi:hypothetical protein [Nocardiopsis sp. MG754419]|uniref:hypothetical protein n=1 Tax=Nocardiopsis sp. MG754419 TaxID=2259865 RepID=UPI001BA726BE|nr:hypothetical protein [Nocardiopsis sp. MG754419]
MSTEQVALLVTEARDHFSDRADRAVHGGEVTFVTRGRGHQRAAALGPADVVDHDEQPLGERDARVAAERLADVEARRVHGAVRWTGPMPRVRAACPEASPTTCAKSSGKSLYMLGSPGIGPGHPSGNMGGTA